MSESIAVGLRIALAAAYGLPDAELSRVTKGQSTLNYAGTAGGRRIFVKCYPAGADLHAEQHAILLSEYAGEAGVPTARVIASRQGKLIHATAAHSFSVWEFADGQSADSAPLLTPQRMSAAGHAVGHLHRVLATYAGPGPTLRPGAEVCHLETAAETFTATLAAYTAKTEPSDFDRWTVEVLSWRLSLLPRLARLLSSLPALTSQVVHGDLASPNLLYRDASLTAIIDFRPPRPRQLGWEISRLACDPRTIVRRPDWPHGLQDFLTAYQAPTTAKTPSSPSSPNSTPSRPPSATAPRHD